jgi:DNA replication and repair protein RecF
MEMISKVTFGEIFLTDTRPERSKTILGTLDAEVFFFEVEKGEVIN